MPLVYLGHPTESRVWTRFNPAKTWLTNLSLEGGHRLNYWDAMRYFFHILDGSKFFPDGAGNNLTSLEYAKRLAEVVADELKKGGEFCRSSLVIVADENGKHALQDALTITIYALSDHDSVALLV